ncbi:DNA cytosine methyltransferase [Wenzhouxiangella sp. EGI_FJ10305]|uniref:DNA cytosine methyltransferase n=1 Tax=Wenzhouxiangella sp. EGI_FJ10305 TaxID=3243768 RepID=UPI0035D58426
MTDTNQHDRRRYLEFFAGGGMARSGLGANWHCVFANDIDPKKAKSYTENWGGDHLRVGDIREISVAELPTADLAWASFPCQDLSLAGGGAGLRGDRSGTFWPFWHLMKQLIEEERAPSVIALENVCGTLTSHQGQDFAAICETYHTAGYRVGAVVIDAARFVPQSRPRLFVIGVKSDIQIPQSHCRNKPDPEWHSRGVLTAYDRLPQRLKESWVWWHLPCPSARQHKFADLIEEEPTGVEWHTVEETKRLLAMMTDVNLAKVREAERAGTRKVGAVYKRTRQDEDGYKVQRAEVRFDDIAGCLRTPAGGSSRQLILVVDGPKIRSRLISTREAARLMGLPDSYWLPEKYNETYHLLGDGVVVPVVRHLAANLIEPILMSVHKTDEQEAA